MTRLLLLRAMLALALGATAAAGLSCGKDAKTAENEAALDLDGDPLALLPSSGVVLANLDARSFYASNGLAAQMAKMAERIVPIGDESGFIASRDVDRVVAGVYVGATLDTAAIVSGHFDEARVGQAARNGTLARTGSPIVESSYAGRRVFASAGIAFTILTAKTAVAGTEGGIRRVLDKIQDRHLGRGFPAWMIATIETKGAPFAFAVDLAQPLPSAVLDTVKFPFLVGLQAVRFIGNFASPGMHVAATLSYADADKAKSAADAIRVVDGLAKVFGPMLTFIPKVQDLDVTTNGADVQGKFSIDETAAKGMLDMMPKLFGGS